MRLLDSLVAVIKAIGALMTLVAGLILLIFVACLFLAPLYGALQLLAIHRPAATLGGLLIFSLYIALAWHLSRNHADDHDLII